MELNKREFGSMGEQIAKDFLLNNGYIILAQNYRVGRIGEIDIIAKQAGYLCFVEVKTRKNNLFGSPAEAVNYKKQETIRRIAACYINKYKYFDKNVRFDIVEVLIDKSNETKSINIIKNAF